MEHPFFEEKIWRKRVGRMNKQIKITLPKSANTYEINMAPGVPIVLL